MNGLLKAAALFVLCASFGLQAGVYRWVDESGRTHFSDRPPPSTESRAVEVVSERARTPAPSSQSGGDSDESVITASLLEYQQPPASETLQIRRLFEAGRFEQLNLLLDESLRAIKDDIDKELRHREVYRAFELDDPVWEARFERWIAQHPDQYQGYLARATYLVHRGWRARGGAFIDKTPRENLVRMAEFMGRAQSDLARTLGLENGALWAYCLRISIAKTSNNWQESLNALEQATQRYPTTYLVRKYYLDTLDPKWGGSQFSMVTFANNAQRYAASNPRIQQLVSQAYYEAGRMAFNRREHSQALELLSIAIERGTQPRAYYIRGRTHASLGDHEQALLDFNVVINRGREDEEYYLWRARSFVALKRYREALMDIQRAHALNPNHEPINNLRLRLMSYAQTPNLVPADAGVRSSDEAESLFSEARALIENNQQVQARHILDRAIDLKPDEFRYYQLIDHALFKQGKLRDILGYWERYLAIKPNDGRAYLERAGTYYHLQDFDAAMVDTRRAIALGNEDAKRLYQRLESLGRR